MNLHKRLICVLTGLACVALLASCTPHGANTQSVTITEAGNASDLIGPPIQTDTGWDVAIPDSTTTARDNCEATDWPVTYLESPNNENGSASSEAAKPESTLVSLNPQDGSVRWARTIKPAMRTHTFGGNSNTPQSLFLRSQQCAIAALVSNERYLAFYLRPWMASEGSSSIGDQRMNIVVLNAATGNEVRTIEVSGLVLGQAIVNDSLVVETAQNSHAEPTTTRTDNWLIGSTNDSLLMSPQNSLMRLPNLDSYLISTIIRTTVAGEELETITGVTAIHPNSWIERAKNPQEAAETAASPDKTPLAALPRDLINIDSGASVDVTGQYVTSVNLPTGPGLLLRTVTTTGEGEEKKTTYINHSWLPATSDSTEPRADDMQQIDLDNKANKVFSKPIRMGEEEK